MRRREPIVSIEAEKGVIGSALSNPGVVRECEELFAPELYDHPAHKTMAKAIRDAERVGLPVDYLAFTQFLRDRQELEKIGGAAYLTKLFALTGGTASAEYYGGILREKFALRQVVDECDRVINLAYERQDDPEVVFTEAQSALLKIAATAGGKTRTVTMRENAMRAHERVEAIMLGTAAAGLTTGIEALDRKLGGLHDGEVTAITGDTGGGKTSLAHNIVDHVAVDLGRTVQLFSYELRALTVTNRLIAARGSINTEHIRKAQMTEKEMKSFTTAHDRLAEAPIFIEDDANTTMAQLAAKARKLKASHDTALIVIDYIQKIPGSGKEDRRQREIAQNSDGVQKLAMELNIPIIVLAQWNKKDGTVREAADIVFDAKTLLKIVRDESKDVEDEGASAFRDIVIAKNNNGAVGKVAATFRKEFVRFEAK